MLWLVAAIVLSALNLVLTAKGVQWCVIKHPKLRVSVRALVYVGMLISWLGAADHLTYWLVSVLYANVFATLIVASVYNKKRRAREDQASSQNQENTNK